MPRRDGWTPETQQRFIEALARTGVVERACEAVDMSVTSAYNLRNAPGGERFAKAWHAVLARAADRMLDIAFEHAIEGEEVPVFDRDGLRVGSKRRYNTRMAMFMLRAYFPERFRHADRDTRRPDEPAAPHAQPVARIVETLAPVPPAEPHLLATPARLDDMADGARVLADHDADFQSSEREVYRPRRVPDDHPPRRPPLAAQPPPARRSRGAAGRSVGPQLTLNFRTRHVTRSAVGLHLLGRSGGAPAEGAGGCGGRRR